MLKILVTGATGNVGQEVLSYYGQIICRSTKSANN